LLAQSELVAELRIGLESAQAQIDLATRELHTAQNRLQQLLPSLTTLVDQQIAEQAQRNLALPSLVTRILNQSNGGSRFSTERPRNRLIREPAPLLWDELDLEQYGEKELFALSLSEAISAILMAASHLETAQALHKPRLEEYNLQVSNLRASTLLLRQTPLLLLLPPLQQIVEKQCPQVNFEVQGMETEVDQEIMDLLSATLIQLFQNCLQGTPPEDAGNIWLHARGVGNEVLLEIGFSMPVTGGALDLLRDLMQQLSGTYTLQGLPAGGIRFGLRFLRSQGAAQCLLVRAGHQYVLVPFSQVQQILAQKNVTLDQSYHLCDLLGFPASTPTSDLQPVLILPQESASRKVIGVIVDEVINEVEYMVKPLVPYLQRPGIIGAAADGHGQVMLMLDLSELVRSHHPHQSTTIAPEQGPIKVLVADDSVSLRLALITMLQQERFSIEEAKDGMEALIKARTTPPDIILVDVEMPNLNGYELLDMLSQYPELQNVKTIMLSSRSSDKHKRHARILGAHAYLTKPCTQEDLIETINHLLTT
jgi:CheY-like chemotaxis protein